MGGTGSAQLINNTFSKNNIYHLWKPGKSAFYQTGSGNEIANDLYNGTQGDATIVNGINGTPVYAPGNGWQSESGGNYQLDASSPGYGKGARIPNFNDGAAAPDVGAHQSGSPSMKFGIAASTGSAINAQGSVTPVTGPPTSPTMGAATPVGGQVSVTFMPGSLNGGTLTHHHVTCTSASATVAYNGYGSSSPIVVSGLPGGTAYHCWARTVTNLGSSAWSSVSNWATPTAVNGPPSAPMMGTATAGAGQLSVTFTPGSLNGGTLSYHHVTCTSAAGTVAYNGYGSSSPVVVRGLAAGTAYRCWARTVTNLGASAWSGASNWGTPTP
jgi:hypothetical protein